MVYGGPDGTRSCPESFVIAHHRSEVLILLGSVSLSRWQSTAKGILSQKIPQSTGVTDYTHRQCFQLLTENMLTGFDDY